jgi:hypothetical protein
MNDLNEENKPKDKIPVWKVIGWISFVFFVIKFIASFSDSSTSTSNYDNNRTQLEFYEHQVKQEQKNNPYGK